MSHTALSDGHISRVHNMAICEEIGERLRPLLDTDRTDTPL
jgi:hypothetical protein